MASSNFTNLARALAKGDLDFDINTFKVMLVSAIPSEANLDAWANRSDVTSEITGTGYTAGGATLSGFSVTVDGTTAVLDFTDPTWANSTITARGALIYNSTQSNKAVAVLDFGADISSTNDTFTITFPAAAAATGLVRIA